MGRRKRIGIAVGVVGALAAATLGVASRGGEPGQEGGDIRRSSAQTSRPAVEANFMRESYRPNETATLVIETPPRTVGTQLLRVGERPSARRRDELPSAERFEPPDAHAGDRLDRGGPSAWPRLTAVRSTDSPRAPSCAGRQNEPTGSDGWPVKPFHSQHPVRGSFGDPRIGPSGNEIVRTFHFGIDVSAPDATPVYATATGTVSVYGDPPRHAADRATGRSAFEYWHVIPAVRAGQHVVAYRTVLGHIATGWGHVHFAERRGGAYLNPLRSGAIFPYADTTCPGIGEVRFERAGIRQKARGLKGRLDIAVRAEDAPPLSAPAPWRELPVTPARVQWRIVGEHGSIVMPWQSVHDVRQVLPRGAFESVYTSDTRQNRPNRPGVYRFNLARGWDAGSLPAGIYRIQVLVADTAGNAARLSQPFTITG